MPPSRGAPSPTWWLLTPPHLALAHTAPLHPLPGGARALKRLVPPLFPHVNPADMLPLMK